MATLTKRQIIRQIANDLGISQALAQKLVQRTLESIIETVVEQGRIELRNFGVFQIKARAARQARNPRTNEPVLVPPRNAITFQPSKNFVRRTDRLNISQARNQLARLGDLAQLRGERTVIGRRGKELCAVVSVEDLDLLEHLEDLMDLDTIRQRMDEPTTDFEKFAKQLGL